MHVSVGTVPYSIGREGTVALDWEELLNRDKNHWWFFKMIFDNLIETLIGGALLLDVRAYYCILQHYYPIY